MTQLTWFDRQGSAPGPLAIRDTYRASLWLQAAGVRRYFVIRAETWTSGPWI
jgi:hypothetical protein